VVEYWNMVNLQGLLRRSGQFLRALGQHRAVTFPTNDIASTTAVCNEPSVEAAEVDNMPVAAGDRE
jgi:hypothetical protein